MDSVERGGGWSEKATERTVKDSIANWHTISPPLTPRTVLRRVPPDQHHLGQHQGYVQVQCPRLCRRRRRPACHLAGLLGVVRVHSTKLLLGLEQVTSGGGCESGATPTDPLTPTPLPSLCFLCTFLSQQQQPFFGLVPQVQPIASQMGPLPFQNFMYAIPNAILPRPCLFISHVTGTPSWHSPFRLSCSHAVDLRLSTYSPPSLPLSRCCPARRGLSADALGFP